LYVHDERELTGIPRDVIADARANAQAEGRAGWKLTLRMACYLPGMQYDQNRALRETLHRGYLTRASDLGLKAEWDNTPIINEMLKLRREAATLLGYRNYATVSLVPKMAQTPDEVLAF